MTEQIDIGTIERVGTTTELDEDNFISNGEKYLTFLLGDEYYAVNILSVKEINGWDQATLIPNSPDYVKGVVNLRGVIVPIVDLRIRFNVGEVQYLPTTVVIMISSQTDSGEKMVGFIVDAVSDVLEVTEDKIKKAPDFDGSVPRDTIYGMVNSHKNVVTLLDINQLIQVDR